MPTKKQRSEQRILKLLDGDHVELTNISDGSLYRVMFVRKVGTYHYGEITFSNEFEPIMVSGNMYADVPFEISKILKEVYSG